MRLLRSKKTRLRKKLDHLDIDSISKLPEPRETWVPARISRVIDGDTVEVIFLHGKKVPMKIGMRIVNVDTPEISKAKTELEKEAGLFVKQKVEELLFVNNDSIEISFKKWDKYGGRIVGDIQYRKGSYLSDYLILRRYAQIYDGKKKSKWSIHSLQGILGDSLASSNSDFP